MSFNALVFGFIYILPIIPFIFIMIWYVYSKKINASYADLNAELKQNEEDWMDMAEHIIKKDLVATEGDEFIRSLNLEVEDGKERVRKWNYSKGYIKRSDKGIDKIANKVKNYIIKNT